MYWAKRGYHRKAVGFPYVFGGGLPRWVAGSFGAVAG
jgi:hypothetical protein